MMENNKPVLAVFPYIEIDHPLEIRGEVLFPSTFLTSAHEEINKNDDKYDTRRKQNLNRIKSYLGELRYTELFFEEANSMLQEIQKFFYWFTNENINKISWCYSPASASQRQRLQFRTHIDEIRKILGYLWCLPDSRPQFLSLYGNYEQLDYYFFVPENVIWEGGVRCIRFEPLEAREAGKPKYVKGYNYFLNQVNRGNIIEGCRIYPSTKSIFGRRGEGFQRILEEHQSKISLLFPIDEIPNAQAERIFDAIEWYNRSCYAEITSDVSLIYLAIAFETLLLAPRDKTDDRSKTDQLYSSIRVIVGEISRLDQWVKQFYVARSRIIHEGKWSQMQFIIADQENKPKSTPTNSEYGFLIHYGWLIFRICLNSVILGLSNSSANKLQARFFTNQEQLEEIHKVLIQTLDSYETINAVIDNIRVLSDIYLRDNNSVDENMLLKVAKLLAEKLLPLVDAQEEKIALQKIIEDSSPTKVDDELQIIEYALLVFKNTDELPYEKVREPALADLGSNNPPSLEQIKERVQKILDDSRNNLSDQLRILLSNIITLINYSFIRFQLLPVAEIAENSSRSGVTKHRPFSLMEGYSQFVKDIVERIESDTQLAMLSYKSHVGASK
jgi:hypothetical protein